MATREYRGEHLTVTWDSGVCIHSTNCWKGLPEVFTPREKPWINPAGASDENIAAAIDRCPSGALGYRWDEGHGSATNEAGPAEAAPADSVTASRSEPVTITAELDGPYYVEGPVRVCNAAGDVIYEGERIWMCRCGSSNKKPLCDGSHRKANFKG